MAETYRSSVTAAELERARRPKGVLAHLLHSIAPPRTNKAYDPGKEVGPGNQPYAEPGFFRRLAGDPGRTWNQLALEDQADLGVTEQLANKEHGRAAQLIDKEFSGRGSLLDKEIASRDALESKRAGNAMAQAIYEAVNTGDVAALDRAAALERAKVAAAPRTDPNLSRYYGSQADFQDMLLKLYKPQIEGGANGVARPAASTQSIPAQIRGKVKGFFRKAFGLGDPTPAPSQIGPTEGQFKGTQPKDAPSLVEDPNAPPQASAGGGIFRPPVSGGGFNPVYAPLVNAAKNSAYKLDTLFGPERASASGRERFLREKAAAAGQNKAANATAALGR